MTTTIDPDDIARFSAIADEWWDPNGKFRPLHLFNPVRLAFIRDQATNHFGISPEHTEPLKELRLLDVGCGGGLLSQPMARLGASVTAIDASEKNIQVASLHAQKGGLDIDFRHTSIEDLAATDPQKFDIILNMEVVEHVADPDLFMTTCADLLAPGGIMIVATLNRTTKSFALGIVGAEYIMRWLPVGTHDWRQFLKPSEIKSMLSNTDVVCDAPQGVTFNPLTWKWSLGDDTSVNYMMVVRKPKT